jgi:kumamolisin
MLALACGVLLLGSVLPAAAAPSPAPEAAATCPVVVKNGNFEAAPAGANWTQSGANGAQLIDTLNPRTGKYGAYLGDANNANHSIRQTITLPRRPVILSFWWEQWTQETAPGDAADYLTVSLLKTDGSLLKEVARLGVDPDRPPWERLSFDLSAYAGQTVQLQFLARNDSTNPTAFFIDDVSIPGCRTYLPMSRK